MCVILCVILLPQVYLLISSLRYSDWPRLLCNNLPAGSTIDRLASAAEWSGRRCIVMCMESSPVLRLLALGHPSFLLFRPAACSLLPSCTIATNWLSLSTVWHFRASDTDFQLQAPISGSHQPDKAALTHHSALSLLHCSANLRRSLEGWHRTPWQVYLAFFALFECSLDHSCILF